MQKFDRWSPEVESNKKDLEVPSKATSHEESKQDEENLEVSGKAESFEDPK